MMLLHNSCVKLASHSQNIILNAKLSEALPPIQINARFRLFKLYLKRGFYTVYTFHRGMLLTIGVIH